MNIFRIIGVYVRILLRTHQCHSAFRFYQVHLARQNLSNPGYVRKCSIYFVELIRDKAIPVQVLGLNRRVGLVEFLGIRHTQTVRLSALGTGRFHLPAYIPGTHFC
jgi:hypothetical protein